MNAPRFLIAKYTPDLHRMEPRNFGVIAWVNGNIAARFLGESVDGHVRPPHMVAADSRDAYRQWIEYWRMQLAKPRLELANGQTIERASADFCDALRIKSKEQFMLVDAGMLLKDAQASELPEIIDELFSTLVEHEPAENRHQAEADTLRRAAVELFKSTGLSARPDFHEKLPQPCHVHGVLKEFVFDNALGDVGRPDAVFQRVLLMREQSVCSAVHMLEWYSQSPVKPTKDRRYAFVHSLSGRLANDQAVANRTILAKLATVVDLANPQDARRAMAGVSHCT